MPAKPLARGQLPVGTTMCAGACVCWFSRMQKCVTFSATEAEYVAPADTIKGAMFVRYLWAFIFPGSGERCTTVFENNEGARHLAQDPVCTRRTQNISTCDTTFCFARDDF